MRAAGITAAGDYFAQASRYVQAGLFTFHQGEKAKPASKPDRGKQGHLQRIAECVRAVLFTFVKARA